MTKTTSRSPPETEIPSEEEQTPETPEETPQEPETPEVIPKALSQIQAAPVAQAEEHTHDLCGATHKDVSDHTEKDVTFIEWTDELAAEQWKDEDENIVETKKPEKSRQKAAGCRNTQEVIYTQPLFITPFYLLKGYRSDRLDINIPVIPKAARRDGFTR